MARSNSPVVTFNAGRVSHLALARVDQQKMRFAAEEQTNFIPRVLGPMMLRPGLQYKLGTKNNAVTWPVPFIFSHDDTAIIEFVGAAMRVLIDETPLTRTAVSTTVTSGDFSASAGWTLVAATGNTASISGGSLRLVASVRGTIVSASQAIPIALQDLNVEHALRIVVTTGPVKFRLGTSDGDDDIMSETLGQGEHSLAFTPTSGLIYVEFESRLTKDVYVDSIQIEAAGVVELTSPYDPADFPLLRHEQSGDVVYIACEDYQQRKVERRAARSWSLVYYMPEDGPVRFLGNNDISLTPSHTGGNIILTSSEPYFKTSMEGGLIRVFTPVQSRQQLLGAEDTYSDPIRITGVANIDNAGGNNSGLVLTLGALNVGGTFTGPSTRTFRIQGQGTWVGTVTLQRSFDGPDSGFQDITTPTPGSPETNYDGPFDWTFTDEFDNSVVWYRLGFKAGNYTSGSANVILQYPSGGGPGYIRILNVLTSTTARSEVTSKTELSSSDATKNWQEGEWSTRRGFPTCVRLFEGRLWWFGKDRIWGSVSDAYESFDIDFLGDAGPISRSIGYGPIDRIQWALAMPRLIVGLEGSEASIRSSALDQPLTPTNFGIKDASTQGAAGVDAVKVDTRGIFVQKSKRRIYQLAYSFENNDYIASDLTAFLPDIDSDIVRLVVQRQPDTRVHAIRADGKVMILTFEPTQEVICWTDFETDGVVENAIVLPGDVEDRVYYYVKRTIDGETVRYLERWAQENECVGAALNKQADSFIIYSGASATTITGLGHLEGEEVVVWGNSKDLGAYTVTGGQITGLSEAVTSAIVGLTYRARFKSAKLAYAAALGTALTQKKKVNNLGLILRKTHAQGLHSSGLSFDTMDNLPLMYRGVEVNPDLVYDDFDEPMIEVPGDWSTDSRLYLEANAPRPAMVLGAVIGITTNDKS